MFCNSHLTMWPILVHVLRQFDCLPLGSQKRFIWVIWQVSLCKFSIQTHKEMFFFLALVAALRVSIPQMCCRSRIVLFESEIAVSAIKSTLHNYQVAFRQIRAVSKVQLPDSLWCFNFWCIYVFGAAVGENILRLLEMMVISRNGRGYVGVVDNFPNF